MDSNKKQICCGSFEKTLTHYGWYSTERSENIERRMLMPHLKGTTLRVNNCPICGADVRAVEFSEEEFDNLNKQHND